MIATLGFADKVSLVGRAMLIPEYITPAGATIAVARGRTHRRPHLRRFSSVLLRERRVAPRGQRPV